MPRKIPDLLAQGFVLLRGRGKGDHRRFEHPDHPDLAITLDGQSGDDAKPYQEKQIRRAIAEIAERRA